MTYLADTCGDTALGWPAALAMVLGIGAFAIVAIWFLLGRRR